MNEHPVHANRIGTRLCQPCSFGYSPRMDIERRNVIWDIGAIILGVKGGENGEQKKGSRVNGDVSDKPLTLYVNIANDAI